ncbi:NACHT domain-containing protein [Nocardioides sambongensis]|uniref:NACHT domain-containing protein n=1 Tax=Nocardioides sambongensis TaxID=2589074 RepID=UPI0011270331|nr:large ATP-binding protein [Nocardioides sambongensis]
MAEDEYRYLYERLSPGEFQQLVSALLSYKYADFRAFPIGQADGGRDGSIDDPGAAIVFQDKWSKRGREKDPVKWLTDAIEGEEKNIRALAGKGVRRYILVTNLEGTSMRDQGQMDKFDVELRKFEKKYEMPQMECVWRPTLNAWVNGAPTEIVWAFADMLAGWDLVRYLISEFVGSNQDTRTRHLVRKIAAVAWKDDEKLKFSQLAIGKHRVADLYVDVGARQLHAPVAAAGQRFSDAKTIPISSTRVLPSASDHVVTSVLPYTLVLGAPGQGKSTLTQYLCQSHRARFVSDDVRKDGLFELKDDQVRFPVRVELGMYAAWFEGEDVFEEEAPKGKRKSLKDGSIELFLADVFAHATGDASIDSRAVDDLLNLVPALVVFDGLDEVGNFNARKRVVEEIERFCAAGAAYKTRPRVLVTSRPNASDLPEPSEDMFEMVALEPFTDKQISTYMQRWCLANEIKAADGRKVRKAFRARAQEAYIGELASNPMQLTILLDLLNRDGEAAPTQRTDLYDSYVELLLIREANRHPKSVKNHQGDLKDIVPFLGWYIQSRSEEHNLSGRMSKAEIEAAMEHFQITYSKPTAVVGELLDAASDRLWALTSKEQGTYEFDIQSLREYFAAKFLYRFAGEENREFDKTDVLRALLCRPYWFNTARFYGGNADTTDLYVLAGGIEDAVEGESDRQTLIVAWTLLTDGVFNARPRQANQVLKALLRDDYIPVLREALSRRQIVSLPGLPTPSSNSPVWDDLTQRTLERWSPQGVRAVRAIHDLLGCGREFGEWWRAQLPSFIGTEREHDWMRTGAAFESGTGHVDDSVLARIALANGGAEMFLNAGLSPSPGSSLEAQLVSEVLDGQVQAPSSTNSHPARVAVALSPAEMFTDSPSGFTDSGEAATRRRNDAIRGLGRVHSPFQTIAKERVFKKGEKGSTFPWSRTATALFDEVGHCWLASTIAVIGAAHPHNTGAAVFNGTTAFGPKHHPATLLRETRAHADDEGWWKAQLDAAQEDLARAEWALALWAVATTKVLDVLLPTWALVAGALPSNRRTALDQSVTLLNASGVLRSRPIHTATSGGTTERLVLARGGRRGGGGVSLPSSEPPPALAITARDEKWLLVDKISPARYR